MMAGQIEEPISFSFQADSIHSGSISFGRFADEPLLWERRLSFSHNRIQEEVARCSKHRIVTQKKAYFEAQFKRKALLRQSSLDAQSGVQFEANAEETSDRSHAGDYGFVQEYKNDASSDTSVYIGYTEDYDYVQEAQVSLHYDESADGSNNLEKQGMMECNIEGKDILISKPLKLPSADGVEAKAKVDDGTVTALDAQTVIDCTHSRCDSADHDVEVELSIDAYTSYVDEECNAIGLCAGSWDAEKKPDAVSHYAVVCPEIMVSTEPSETELNVRSSQTPRDSECIAAKASSQNLKRMGKQSSATETKTFKHSKIIPSTANKLARSPNPERLLTKSTSSISKTMSGHKSAIKEIRVVKVTKSPHTTTAMKDAPNGHHSPNRTEKLRAPINSSLKTWPTSIRSRSNLQEEQKKGMLSRLGQTSHIQKTEVNRSRAGGKSPDESKQVMRGLSSKPKPTQSLHSKDNRFISKSKNAIANRPQVNPSYLKTKVVARPSTNLKAENGLPKSPFQVSTITSHPTKKSTKTSAVSSLASKSTHLSSMRNAVVTNGMAGNDKAAKLKNQTLPTKVEAIKGRVSTQIPQPISEKTKKCPVRNVTEKPRLQEMRRTTAKVC